MIKLREHFATRSSRGKSVREHPNHWQFCKLKPLENNNNNNKNTSINSSKQLRKFAYNFRNLVELKLEAELELELSDGCE